MFPEILNSREDAILLWSLVILGSVLYKDFRGIAGSFLGVLRALFHPKLLMLFGSALLYSAALVYAASGLGLWHMTTLKATVYWFVGSAVVLAGAAVTEGARSEGALLRKVFRRVVAVTVVTEFLVNVYALPFAAEVCSSFCSSCSSESRSFRRTPPHHRPPHGGSWIASSRRWVPSTSDTSSSEW